MGQKLFGRSRLLLVFLLVSLLSACQPPAQDSANVTENVSDSAAETATESTSETAAEETSEDSSENAGSETTGETVTEETATQEGATEAIVANGEGTTTASGLQYTILEQGDGEMPQAGDMVAVHYTGKLDDGTIFDSSYSRGEPIQFALGRGQVIPGWDEGISLLNVGSKALLTIPPELGYGERGAGNVIPANATLTFEVELVGIQEGAPAAATDVDEADYVETDSGLKYYDFVVGDGPSPETGQSVSVHYTGWLLEGDKFDSSLDRGQPFAFEIGMGRVIPGWDEGVASMKVGGKRQLVIPAALGYGERGAGNVIPPNSTLVFEVELLGVK